MPNPYGDSGDERETRSVDRDEKPARYRPNKNPDIRNTKDMDGVVKWFDLVKGFGFIEITQGEFSGSDVFVHAVDVEGNPLAEGDKVRFDICDDDRSRNGGKRAEAVSGGTAPPNAREQAKGRGKGGKEGHGGYGGRRGNSRRPMRRRDSRRPMRRRGESRGRRQDSRRRR